MKRCWGFTRTLRRCGRSGDWLFFCHDHRLQPIFWLSLVFSAIASLASIYSAWQPSMKDPDDIVHGYIDHVEKALEDGAKLYKSNLETRKKLQRKNINVKFDDWGRNSIRVAISSYQRDPKIVLYYAIDDNDFQKIDRYPFVVPMPEKSFVIEFRDETGKVIERIDKIHALMNSLRISFNRNIKEHKKRKHNSWGCDIFGCKFRKYSTSGIFCSAFVKSVKLGDQHGQFKDELDLSLCIEHQDVCKNAQDMSFPIKPGVPIHAQLELRDGTKQILDIPVVLSFSILFSETLNQKDMAGWMELFPINDRNSGGKAPILISSYKPASAVVGEFRLMPGIGVCHHSGYNASSRPHLLIDTDGRGLVDIGRFNGGVRVAYSRGWGDKRTSTHKFTLGPHVNEIGFAIEYADGYRIGPFWYMFDAAEVVRQTAALGVKPEVNCDSGRYGLCFAKNPHGWFEVAQVEFSDRQGVWKETVDINFNARTYLEKACNTYKNDCLPFLFNIPTGWLDVHSRITMKDGKVLRPVRHMLRLTR